MGLYECIIRLEKHIMIISVFPSFCLYVNKHLLFISDIDECQQDFTCDHKCSNTNGSYICSCYSGFIKDKNGKCQGIFLFFFHDILLT